eukprot:scaffold4036_cov39-Attheya_sp.AAC.1
MAFHCMRPLPNFIKSSLNCRCTGNTQHNNNNNNNSNDNHLTRVIMQRMIPGWDENFGIIIYNMVQRKRLP